MRKMRYLTAALCAVVLLCSAALPAYASSGEEWESVEVTEKEPVQTVEPTPAPTVEPTPKPTPQPSTTPSGTVTGTSKPVTSTPVTSTDKNSGGTTTGTEPAVSDKDASQDTESSENDATGGVDWEGLTPVNPLTPDGQGTVLDSATDAEGKEFFTITTADGDVFYLVIDRQKNGENVYFLNAVTVSDLLALAESKGETLTVPSITPVEPDLEPIVSPEPEPEPDPEPEQKGGGNMGTLLLTLAVVAFGGVAGWYFKIYRPKQQRAADLEEDDYPAELEPEFEDDYDDTPPWDEDNTEEGE